MHAVAVRVAGSGVGGYQGNSGAGGIGLPPAGGLVHGQA